MKAKFVCGLGMVVIFLSSSLGYGTMFIYDNINLAASYETVLNGYIHSYMLIGFIIFSLGFVNYVLEKKGN
ncbi:MAG TPA: glycosyl transferase [Firmicutes bacterium]|nr:glycosyl transferase [Bacillota bacterium]